MDDTQLRRRWSLRVGLTASLLAAVAGSRSAATSDEVSIEIMMERHLGYSGERCLLVDSTQPIKVEVETPYPVDFNIHHHTDVATEFAVKTQVRERYVDTVTLTSLGEQCFQFSNVANQAQDFVVRVRFSESPAD